MAPTTPPPCYDSPTMGDGRTDLPCPTLHFHVTFSTFPTSSAWLCSTTLLDVKCGSLVPVINDAMNSIFFFVSEVSVWFKSEISDSRSKS